MLTRILKAIFGSKSSRDVKRLLPKVKRVNELEAEYQKLSEDRANSVRDYMIENGIEAERVTAVGYGPSRPKGDNSTEAGRRANRRIELKVLNADEVNF